MTVDYLYYTDTFKGEPVEEADFPRLLARAQDAIDTLLFGKLSGMDNMAACVQETVRRALCAQVEYYALNGVESAVTGAADAGFTVGHVSAQGGSTAVSWGDNIAGVCPSSRAMLERTGLLYRGCYVL